MYAIRAEACGAMNISLIFGINEAKDNCFQNRNLPTAPVYDDLFTPA